MPNGCLHLVFFVFCEFCITVVITRSRLHRHKVESDGKHSKGPAKCIPRGWQEATASKDPLVKRSKYLGVQRANNVYPKGLARGDCIQRPPDREVQIPRGLKGQQGVSQWVGKGNSKGKSKG